jgi:hypothetical protein
VSNIKIFSSILLYNGKYIPAPQALYLGEILPNSKKYICTFYFIEEELSGGG